MKQFDVHAWLQTDGKGVGLLIEPNSSSTSEAVNDMLSSSVSHSLPPNKTRSLAATEES